MSRLDALSNIGADDLEGPRSDDGRFESDVLCVFKSFSTSSKNYRQSSVKAACRKQEAESSRIPNLVSKCFTYPRFGPLFFRTSSYAQSCPNLEHVPQLGFDPSHLSFLLRLYNSISGWPRSLHRFIHTTRRKRFVLDAARSRRVAHSAHSVRQGLATEICWIYLASLAIDH